MKTNLKIREVGFKVKFIVGFTAIVLFATGCQSSNLKATSGFTGCAPEDIEISNSKIDLFGPAWTAVCDGVKYHCIDSFYGNGQCTKAKKQ